MSRLQESVAFTTFGNFPYIECLAFMPGGAVRWSVDSGATSYFGEFGVGLFAQARVVLLWWCGKSESMLEHCSNLTLLVTLEESVHASWRAYDSGAFLCQAGFSHSLPEPFHLCCGIGWSVHRIIYQEDWLWLAIVILHIQLWWCQEWAFVWGKD